MPDFNLYPNPVDCLAQRYYQTLFKDSESLAVIYVMCTAEQEGMRTIEVLDILTDFFSRRHLINEELFYRIFMRAGGSLLRILAYCADGDLEVLQSGQGGW